MLPANQGLGASLVLLMSKSKSATELSRMAELCAQMERVLLDASTTRILDFSQCGGLLLVF
jgi:hypothetical protein